MAPAEERHRWGEVSACSQNENDHGKGVISICLKDGLLRVIIKTNIPSGNMPAYRYAVSRKRGNGD